MKDFRIVQAKTLLDIYSIAPIRGFNPPSIVVVGSKLNSVSEILYNGVTADEFFVSSDSRIVVRIPPSQVGKDLIDFKAYAGVSILNKSAAVVLELMKPLKPVSGIDRLVQAWMMVFLTTPGSDVFTPSSGGGAATIIGSRTDRRHSSAAADLTVAIERTESEILRLQASRKNVPPEEKLLSSDLESLSFDDATGTLSATVRLKNLINQSAEVSLS